MKGTDQTVTSPSAGPASTTHGSGTGTKAPVSFSVLVPAYNAQDFLVSSVESALAQRQPRRDDPDGTPFDLEVIIVDDASTDDTPRIADELAARDARVRTIHRERNGGEGPARNSGLDVARGEWLVCLDADDLLEPDALATLAARAVRTDADVMLYRFRMFRDLAASWDVGAAYQTGNVRVGADGTFDPRACPDRLYSSFWSSVANKCLRIPFLREQGLRFADTPRIGDVYMMLTSLSCARRVALVDASLYLYRVDVKTSLTNRGDAYPLSFYRACADVHDALVARGLWATFRRGYCNWLVENLPYNLKTMKSLDGYAKLLDAFRDGGFARLGIDDFPRDEAANPWAWDHVRQLRDEGLEEGLFGFVRRMGSEETDMDMRLGELGARAQSLQSRLDEAQRELERVTSERDALAGSASFRVGRALTAPLRKLRDVDRRHGGR